MKLGFTLFITSLMLSVVLLNPKVKSMTMSLFLNTHKKILSQLEIQNHGQKYKIIKVENVKGLAIEVYKINDDGIILLDFHQLSDKKDAFYRFDKEKHNLFLKDINDDGQTEIILPSLDKNMKARLNIFHFDFENEKLVKVTKH